VVVVMLFFVVAFTDGGVGLMIRAHM